MNTYMIPREATNENRFLFFSAQAALFILIAFGIGICFVFILNFVAEASGTAWIKYIGWGICALLCLIGWALGTLKIPESNLTDFFKKTGGEQSYVIIKRAITFNKRRKIYIYERSRL